MWGSWCGNGFGGSGPFWNRFGGFGSFGGFGGGLINLVIVLALIVLAVWVVRILLTQRERPGLHSFAPSPMEVLKRRFAAGEIDREEFERMKRELAS